jgi:hypothetical protein
MTIPKYTNDLLKNYVDDHTIELLYDYSSVRLNASTRIEGYCKFNNCKENFSKSFRCLINGGGAYCKKHVKHTEYTFDKLMNYVNENKIKLLHDYLETKITCQTQIEGYCLVDGCDVIFQKEFSSLITGKGAYCQYHVTVKDPHMYQTLMNFVTKNNVELLRDYKNIQMTTRTIIEGYCIYDDCKEIFTKEFTQFIEMGGPFCPYHVIINAQIKSKNFCLEKYNTEYVFQNEEIRQQIKNTCLNKYGVQNPMENKQVQENTKKTCLDRYNVEYIFQSELFKQKSKITCLKKYGVEYSSQSKIVRDKCIKTCLDRYNVEYVSQSKIFRDKCIKTSLENYGVAHPMQNSIIAERWFINSIQNKDYILPSGKIIKIQGYENLALDILLNENKIDENDIITSRIDVPKIWYETADNKQHRYFTDIYISSQNLCIEVKSTWTYRKDQIKILLTQHVIINSGYNFEVWIFNRKKQRIVIPAYIFELSIYFYNNRIEKEDVIT